MSADPYWFPGSVHPLLPTSPARWIDRPVTTVVTYTAREAFDVAGRLVAKGEVMRESDPLTAIVLKVRPDLLRMGWHTKET
jgi:DNA polymerase elongation subunit (family B)